MFDPVTIIALATLIATIIGIVISYLMLRRTPKPEPVNTPTSPTFIGVQMPGPDDLPSYSKGVERMGFDRGKH